MEELIAADDRPFSDPNETDWEQRYEDGNMPWEKGYASPPLKEWIETSAFAGTILPLRGEMLVPGCGWGHDVRLLASVSSPEAHIIGMDLAKSAVRGARSRTPAEDFPQVSYVLSDFLKPAEVEVHAPADRFDCVFEHTLFCAINPDRRDQYVESVKSFVKPGGLYVAVWYLNPGRDPGETGPPFGVSRQELETRFAGAFSLVDQLDPSRSYPGREGRELVQVWRRN